MIPAILEGQALNWTTWFNPTAEQLSGTGFVGWATNERSEGDGAYCVSDTGSWIGQVSDVTTERSIICEYSNWEAF